MGVAFVTSANFTVVRFITRVHMTMLLSVGAVGESSVTTLELAFERFLA